MDHQSYNTETLSLFIMGQLIWLLSIPFISELIPIGGWVLMYLINKNKIDPAIKKTFSSIKKIFTREKPS